MRICHVSYADVSGGAAIAAYRLHHGLIEQQADSVMLVRERHSDDRRVVELSIADNPSDDARLQKLFNDTFINHLLSQRTGLSNSMFPSPFLGTDISGLPLVRDSAVINLHWVDFILSPAALGRLSGIGRPVVWTLHDQAAFTGGCHYAAGCDHYMADCANCPQLTDGGLGVTQAIHGTKAAALQGLNLTIVSPSKWLARCARESSLLRHCRTEVIPYSLDTSVFQPAGRAAGRRALNLAPDDFCLLFGAHGLGEKRKGFSLLLDAVEECLRQPDFKAAYDAGHVRLVSFGHPDPELARRNINYTALGFVTEDVRIAEFYAASDTVVVPSIEDNYPNVVLESLACGAPTVGFAIGGVPDLLRDEGLGEVVPALNARMLAETILGLYRNPERRKTMGVAARRYIESHHDLPVQAGRYLDLYGELVGARRGAFITERPSTLSRQADVVQTFSTGPGLFDGPTTALAARLPDILQTVDTRVARVSEEIELLRLRYSYGEPLLQEPVIDLPHGTTLPTAGQAERFEVALPPLHHRLHLVLDLDVATDDEICIDLIVGGVHLHRVVSHKAGPLNMVAVVPPERLRRDHDGRLRCRFGLAKAPVTQYAHAGPVRLVQATLFDIDAIAASPDPAQPAAPASRPSLRPLAIGAPDDGWYPPELVGDRQARWLGPGLSATARIMGNTEGATLCVIAVLADMFGKRRSTPSLRLDDMGLRASQTVQQDARRLVIYEFPRPLGRHEALTLQVPFNRSPRMWGDPDSRDLSILCESIKFYRTDDAILAFDGQGTPRSVVPTADGGFDLLETVAGNGHASGNGVETTILFRTGGNIRIDLNGRCQGRIEAPLLEVEVDNMTLPVEADLIRAAGGSTATWHITVTLPLKAAGPCVITLRLRGATADVPVTAIDHFVVTPVAASTPCEWRTDLLSVLSTEPVAVPDIQEIADDADGRWLGRVGRLLLPSGLAGGELLIAGLDLDDRAADRLLVMVDGREVEGRFSRHDESWQWLGTLPALEGTVGDSVFTAPPAAANVIELRFNQAIPSPERSPSIVLIRRIAASAPQPTAVDTRANARIVA